MIEKCLKIAGLHNITRQYSVLGFIESDHTIPHNVWKSTQNPLMKNLVKGSGKRPGENNMPAITIPDSIHQSFLTTGKSCAVQNFHNSLVALCDKGQIDEALIQCFQEYQSKGIDLKEYKDAIEKSLQEYINLNLITFNQKNDILTRLNI